MSILPKPQHYKLQTSRIKLQIQNPPFKFQISLQNTNFFSNEIRNSPIKSKISIPNSNHHETNTPSNVKYQLKPIKQLPNFKFDHSNPNITSDFKLLTLKHSSNPPFKIQILQMKIWNSQIQSTIPIESKIHIPNFKFQLTIQVTLLECSSSTQTRL